MAEYKNNTNKDYHLRQINSPYESTKALITFLNETIKNTNELTALDVACGGGANLIEFARNNLFKNYSGVDISEEALDIGRKFIKENKIDNINLFNGNFYRLENTFSAKKFDITLLIHTLFAVDEPFLILKKLLGISKKYLLLNSLFTNDKVYIKTIAHDLLTDEEYNWNTIPLCKLEEFLNENNAQIKATKDFLMPFDLEKLSNGLGSYTKQLIDGSRLTFTSQIYLPWKFVLIEKKVNS